MDQVSYLIPDEMTHTSSRISNSSVNEKQLESQWFQYKTGDVIHDIHGNAILIIDLGTVNRNEGPDIRGAILFSNGQILKGDIEIHRRTRDWFYHGHEADPNYNHVILHLVHQLDRDDYLLRGHIHCISEINPIIQCDLSINNLNQLFETTLVNMGMNRFQENVNRYRHHAWRDKVLEDLCHLLGKGGNESAFLQLLTHFKNNGKTDPTIHWHRRGIRPNAWPEKRIGMALNLFTYFLQLEEMPKAVPVEIMHSVTGHFLTELKGNILYPLMGANALIHGDAKAYGVIKRDWLCLKLNAPYGRFQKQFGQILSNRSIKNFALSQGLLWLENHWCKQDHCSVCPLKELHGSTIHS